jgi:hypothetical protein
MDAAASVPPQFSPCIKIMKCILYENGFYENF